MSLKRWIPIILIALVMLTGCDDTPAGVKKERLPELVQAENPLLPEVPRISLEEIDLDQEVELEEATELHYERRRFTTVIPNDENVWVWFIDDKTALYGSESTDWAHPRVEIIYEYDFETEETKEIYTFSEDEHYSVHSIQKIDDQYIIMWFDETDIDEAGLFTFYISRLSEQSIEHLFTLKSDNTEGLPTHFVVEDGVARTLCRLDSSGPVHQITMDASGTNRMDPLDQLGVPAFFMNYQGNALAEAFFSQDGEELLFYHLPGGELQSIVNARDQRVGLLGDKLLVINDDETSFSVYDRDLNPLERINMNRRIYRITSLDDKVSFFQSYGGGGTQGYIVDTEEGIKVISLSTARFRFPSYDEKGYHFGYSHRHMGYLPGSDPAWKSEHHVIFIDSLMWK